jgi:hypothetical protein
LARRAIIAGAKLPKENTRGGRRAGADFFSGKGFLPSDRRFDSADAG